jgi:hypothetical protein
MLLLFGQYEIFAQILFLKLLLHGRLMRPCNDGLIRKIACLIG